MTLKMALSRKNAVWLIGKTHIDIIFKYSYFEVVVTSSESPVMNLPFYEMKLRALLAFVGGGNMRYQLLSPGSTSPNVKSSWKHCADQSSVVHLVFTKSEVGSNHQCLNQLNTTATAKKVKNYSWNWSKLHSELKW